MVRITSIRQSNARYASEDHAGLVCVFAGATSGIGAGTLESMARILDRSSPTFYVLGRSATRFESQQRAKLRSLNPSCKFVFLEAELTLLSHVDAVSKQIMAAESKVDYLYMSQGLMPLNDPQYTREGLETCFALSYYCRMRLVQNLLPLLRQAPKPRVLNVLNGGREKAMLDEDIGLEQRDHLSTFAVINNTTTMTSLALDHLAASDNHITFMHAYPGWVQTDIFARLQAPESSGIVWKVTLAVIHAFVTLVMMSPFAVSAEESGERQAFQLTSGEYDPDGGACRLIGYESDVVSAPTVLEEYRRRGWQQKVWEYTVQVFDKVLTGSSDEAAK